MSRWGTDRERFNETVLIGEYSSEVDGVLEAIAVRSRADPTTIDDVGGDS